MLSAHSNLCRSYSQKQSAMKSFGAFMALAALAVSTDALARFDKASCTSSAPTTPINVVAGDGSWSCVSFNIAQNGVFTMPFSKQNSENLALEILLWNDGRTSSNNANGDTRWRNTAAPNNPSTSSNIRADNVWMRKFVPGENGAQSDFNGVDFSKNVTQGGVAMGLGAVAGYTTDAGNNGVYAWYTNSGQLVELNQGRNYIQMWHPNREGTQSVDPFGGKFMYRILRRGNAAVGDINQIPVSDSDSFIDVLPALNVGSPQKLEHFGLPDFSYKMRINHEFATAGYALKGFAYTTQIGGNRIGNLINQRFFFNLPRSYSAYGDANLTFSGSAGTQLKAATEGPDYQLYQNYTNTGRFSPANGVSAKSFLSDITTFKNNWTVPLDVDDFGDATRDDFGTIFVNTPAYRLESGVATALAYDWTVQTSPFMDITVTIDEVVTYPMLSELRNLRLRNWDTDEDAGHNVLSPTQQDAFAIYRVRLDSPLWWRMNIRFNDVRDMNRPAGVPATEVIPACQPLWEVQVVNDFNSQSGSSFNNPNRATNYGRRENGYGETWISPAANADRPQGYDWDNTFGGSSLESDGYATLLNRAWANNNGGVSSSGLELGSVPNTRSFWYLIRVSAVPRVVAGQGSSASDEQCGSNNIMIGSASLEVSGVAGECSSSRDCMVEGDGHPAEGRADSDDSANGDATRFSRCLVTHGLDADGRRFPTSKCVECFSHSHCKAGQYCHLDDGMCTLAGRSTPDGRFGKRYFCDPDSNKMYGVCREKSSDVLGKTCRQHFGNSPTNSASAMHPGLGSSFASPSGGVGGVADSNGNSVALPNTIATGKFDPSNEDFGEGSGGICGEFLFYNGTGVTNADTSITGTFSNPAFSLAGIPRAALWYGFCDEDRICRECVPGAGQQGNGAQGGEICLNGQMYSAADVDGTNRSYTANTQAGTQLGTTFMVILLILLFAFYMYAQAKEYRHANGLKPLTCCETILCCGACAKLSPAGADAAGGGDKTASSAPKVSPA